MGMGTARLAGLALGKPSAEARWSLHDEAVCGLVVMLWWEEDGPPSGRTDGVSALLAYLPAFLLLLHLLLQHLHTMSLDLDLNLDLAQSLN